MPYARPDCLIATDDLAVRMKADDVRILDASFKMPGSTPSAQEDFCHRHIPGARFFDIEAICDRATTLPHMLPSEAGFTEACTALGIAADTLVVVYDTLGLMSAGRAWWMFRAFGHDKVAVLNGGLRKWLAEGRPLENGPAIVGGGDFRAHLRSRLVRTREDVRNNIHSRGEQVIDARSSGRFDGTEPEKWPQRRAGHIPGSLNVPFERMTDPLTGAMKPSHELEKLFEEAGLTGDRPIITTCGSGVTACALAFSLHLLGRDDVSVYDGSWAEWGLGTDTPVETSYSAPCIAENPA